MLELNGEKRHKWFWRFLRGCARGPLCHIFGFAFEQATGIPTPYLVVANHNTDLDPALVAMSFQEQMYFVASEHIFRKGVSSRLLRYIFNPISRMKGDTDASAAMDIIRTLRKGHNVCLFAEGNRSFNGVTGPIFAATGKLARMSGVTLVTYRLEGGYLTTPRWAVTRRKGRMLGYVVNVYSPEQLKAMTPEAVNAAIQADLDEDAFLRQSEQMIPYQGKRLAEGLERALYACPACGKIGTLKSDGGRFFCSCGMETHYLKTGFFAPGAPFSCVRDWDAWQTEHLRSFAAGLKEEDAFSDRGLVLYRLLEDHREQQVAQGTLSLGRAGLRVGETGFSLAQIQDIALVGAAKMVFTASNQHYEVRFQDRSFCGRKYAALYQILKEA